MMGGGERLLIELVDFCLQNNITVEVLIPDNKIGGDNFKEEYYDSYLKERNVKVYRVPVFHKEGKHILSLLYWRLRLKFSGLFYSSVHIVNLNLSDRLYEIIQNKRRYFWHIGNRMQFENGRYPYRQKLASNPADTIVTINKYQLPEMTAYFQNIAAKVISFKLFLK